MRHSQFILRAFTLVFPLAGTAVLVPSLPSVPALPSAATSLPAEEPPRSSEVLPSFVILFADDLGYGDLGCYGHPTIRTPYLDRMAAEGTRFTQFYAAECVCTPSRAALLTGRLPIRTGMCSDSRRVLFPDSSGGLPAEEITLAEALKSKGYRTACVGKWHLGHLPQYLPTRHGFDSFLGLPYSNDMHNEKRGDPPVPLLEGEKVVEQPVRQETLTRRYTDEALRVVRESAGKPFFLYLAYTFPHVPLHASDLFRGKSPRGLYGDVVEELDASVGEILSEIRARGIERSTFVFFTSDNGPWLTQGPVGGSAGLLREGKGSTWEGGMREPAIAWWPGTVPAGRVTRALGSTLDLFTTCLALAGVEPPRDRPIDGIDLRPILLAGSGGVGASGVGGTTAAGAETESGRDVFFYYRGTRLMAVRKGPWKAHLLTQSGYGGEPPEEHSPPLLFHLEQDPSERFDVAKGHPDVVAALLAEVDRHRLGLKLGAPQLEARIEKAKPASTR